MSSEPKKYDEWIVHQMVNLLEAVLTHNSNLLEQSVAQIEHGLGFADEISANLVDVAIKFRTLLRIYRTQKAPESPSSPWAWLVAQSKPSTAGDSFDLSELKSALDTRDQKRKDDIQRKHEQTKQRMSGSIKDLRADDEH